MQNKGLVKLFAFLFGLVSIYQLSFTFKGNQIEKNAEQFAINKLPILMLITTQKEILRG
jgi:SecD/SecF fusion protein